MKWSYSICFENPKSKPPVTVRGYCEAGKARTALSRSVTEALRANKGIRYSSLNVTIERAEAAEEEEG